MGLADRGFESAVATAMASALIAPLEIFSAKEAKESVRLQWKTPRLSATGQTEDYSAD